MALDFSQYAQMYGGGGYSPQTGAQIGTAIGSAIGNIPINRVNNLLDRSMSSSFGGLEDLFLNEDIKSWQDIPAIPDVMASLRNFQNSLGDRDTKIAKRMGLLDPTTFAEKYNKRMALLLPSIANKIQNYQVSTKSSPKDMRKFFENKQNLQGFLRTHVPSLGEGYLNMQEYLSPKITAGDQLRRAWQGFGEPSDWTLGEMAWKVPAAAITGTPGQAWLGGEVAGDIASFAAEQFGAGDKGQRIAEEVGELGGTVGTGIGAKMMMPKIVAGLKKKGIGKVLKKMAKVKGINWTLGMAAKLGIGSVGGAMTGGALTAAMVAMSLKDIYDLYQIIIE